MKFTGEEYNKAFSSVVWSYVQNINSAANKRIQVKLKGSLNHCLRTWSGERATMISVEVERLFLEKNPTLNPFDYIWEKRNIIKGENNRSLLMWEHAMPIKEFIQILVNCKSLDEVEKEINRYPGVCWITKKEDKMLTSAGYRDFRPGGFKKCYESCGIKVMTEQEFITMRSSHSL